MIKITLDCDRITYYDQIEALQTMYEIKNVKKFKETKDRIKSVMHAEFKLHSITRKILSKNDVLSIPVISS